MRVYLFAILVFFLINSAQAQTQLTSGASELLPNSSFEQGSLAPVGWTSNAGSMARWENFGRSGQRCISLGADKPDSTLFWHCDVRLRRGQSYRFSFWSKAQNSSDGIIISGPSALNSDFPFTSEWTRHEYVFVAGHLENDVVRLGQWNGKGRVFFDDVSLVPVQPMHERQPSANQSTWELGEGETIENGRYRFQMFASPTNVARPLRSFTARFNSMRWLFDEGATVVYRHDLEHPMAAIRLSANIGHYTSGTLFVEGSRDGKTWLPLGQGAARGVVPVTVPPALLPTKVLWVRLRGASSQGQGGAARPANFQVNEYRVEADIPALKSNKTRYGNTVYVVKETSAINARVLSLGALQPGGTNSMVLEASLPSEWKSAPLVAQLRFSNGESKTHLFERRVVGQKFVRVAIPYELHSAGKQRLQIALSSGKKILYRATANFQVPTLLAADYGYRVGSLSDVWWSEGGYKIGRERPLPPSTASHRTAAVVVKVARNEYEPFQIVARPSRAVRNVRVAVGDLAGPGGARLASKYFEVCEVAYVPVSKATDSAGSPGLWPDPLPPHRKPIHLNAGENQPFWITLHVPKSARAGDYRGHVTLTGTGWKRVVPLHVKVWNFTLTDETHVQSAFGMSADSIKQFHNLETREEVAKVTQKYLENFAAHRIAPYYPVPFMPIKVDFGNTARWSGGILDTTQFAHGSRSLKVEDTSETANNSVTYNQKLPVQAGQKYFVSWSARAAQNDQPYQITITAFDVHGAEIPGLKLHLVRSGQNTWQQEKAEISSFLTPRVQFVQLELRPTTGNKPVKAMGTVWFDDVQLLGPEETNLLAGGDFETHAPQVKIDWREFDAAAEKAFQKYRFTTWRLPLEGMSWGTFHRRRQGFIGPFAEGTPEHEALFKAYLEQLQAHLEAKGWLDKAYIYWFDEPTPQDYQFVIDGMARIHKYAPKLRRMLTEQPEPALFGSVDLWCSVLNEYDPHEAAQRRQAGEDFWWYICTIPKAPYVTEFIDHPGAGLRTWLWQTWKYDVSGILIWESLYWSSTAAYPNSVQNPWRDPMSWVSGYEQTNVRLPWGNGDGRFLYPPNRDIENDRTKYFDGPINSLRWEMLREGIEDYEYLWLLRECIKAAKKRGANVRSTNLRSAEQLLQVPASVTQDLTTFSHSPLPMLAHRDKVARAIELLHSEPR